MIWLEAMGLETIGLEIGAAVQMAVFGLLAVITIFFAIFVVIAKDVVRAGLALIMCMFGIAALYILLNAQFLGIILFAVMLTKREIGGEPGAD